MSDGLNRVTLIGNLGGDPEHRQANGGGVLAISLACTESWLDQQSGQRKERTEWVNVVVFGKRADGLAKCLGKGDKIAVEGSLRTENWTDRDGNKRYATKVYASNVVLLGGRRGQGGGGGRGSQRQDDDGGYQGDDDNIPY